MHGLHPRQYHDQWFLRRMHLSLGTCCLLLWINKVLDLGFLTAGNLHKGLAVKPLIINALVRRIALSFRFPSFLVCALKCDESQHCQLGLSRNRHASPRGSFAHHFSAAGYLPSGRCLLLRDTAHHGLLVDIEEGQ